MDEDVLLVDRVHFGSSAGSMVLGVVGTAIALPICVVAGVVHALRHAGPEPARRDTSRPEPGTAPGTAPARVRWAA